MKPHRTVETSSQPQSQLLLFVVIPQGSAVVFAAALVFAFRLSPPEEPKALSPHKNIFFNFRPKIACQASKALNSLKRRQIGVARSPNQTAIVK
jgi:hypothetical protein